MFLLTFVAETIKLMKKLLSIILLAFVSTTVLAQKEQATTLPPLVYQQEDAGSHHPRPALPDAGQLPESLWPVVQGFIDRFLLGKN